MNMTNNPQIIEPLNFLREREVVHFQRFGECFDIVQAWMNARSTSSVVADKETDSTPYIRRRTK